MVTTAARAQGALPDDHAVRAVEELFACAVRGQDPHARVDDDYADLQCVQCIRNGGKSLMLDDGRDVRETMCHRLQDVRRAHCVVLCSCRRCRLHPHDALALRLSMHVSEAIIGVCGKMYQNAPPPRIGR